MDAKLGFEMGKVRLALAAICPVRQIKDAQKGIARYKTILASIREVGLVEPLMVHPQKGAPGRYLLLDGHLRYTALKELGESEADCLLSTDDESYTYNARVNRLNPIQEHKMIMKAVQHGVRPERIAAVLNLALSNVRATMSLLDGVSAEAADLLKDKGIAPAAIRMLKRVTALRQVEMAELMISTNNFTAGYAEALVIGTPKDQLVNPGEPKVKEGISPEDIARMEEEMAWVERDMKAVEEGYGENMLNLTLARGYIRKLLENGKVVRHLSQHHAGILGEFETIAAAEAV